MYVPIDRTENDPLTFREVLREFEVMQVNLTKIAKRSRDKRGRFTKKETR